MTEIERGESEWAKVEKGSKITKATAPYYVELSNSYFRLAEFSADPRPDTTKKMKADLKRMWHDAVRKRELKR